MNDACPSIGEAIEILSLDQGLADGRRVVALGWATVDAERAAADLADRWPGCAPFEPAPADLLLGASCLASRGSLDGREGRGARLVLLEPTTEGRLAGWLARHGEGPAAVWLAEDEGEGEGGRGTVAGSEDGSVPASPAADGPFGPERLLAGRPGRLPGGGPHLLLVEWPPSTIDR